MKDSLDPMHQCEMCGKGILESEAYESPQGGFYCSEDCYDEFVDGRMPCDDDDEDWDGDVDEWDEPAYDYDEDLIDGVGFADPTGHSALRAATRRNPRNLPCPTCGEPNRLTPLDRARGYQCDQCADELERGW